jgi:hypothetical protein
LALAGCEFATLEWVDWFNNRRILDPIGNMPPAEALDAREIVAVTSRDQQSPGLIADGTIWTGSLISRW